MASPSDAPRVFFPRNIPYIIDQFQCLVPSVEIGTSPDANTSLPRDELLRRVRGCVGILCRASDIIDAAVLDAAGPTLKVVSTVSVGFNHVDIDACKARAICVGYTPGVLDVTTAETTVAPTFAAKRRIVECVDSARNGGWGVWHPFQYCGTDVTGSTVGIIGLGRIGLTYARMMKFGFGCKIVYAGPSEKPEHVAELGGDVDYLSLDELLRQSDIVSVHMPLAGASPRDGRCRCAEPARRHLEQAATARRGLRNRHKVRLGSASRPRRLTI